MICPPDETKRVEALQQYQILDTPPEELFDNLTRLASDICETPIALITFVDRERQWFKSRLGIEFSESPRDLSLCAHSLLQSDPFIISDVTSDSRFADHPWVTSNPRIRFYAGVPLRTPEGHALGAVCVMDRRPRHLSSNQVDGLETIANETMTLLDQQRELAERRKTEERLRASEEKYRLLFESNPHPMWVFNLETLAFLAVNEAAVRHYGYEREEFLSMTIKQLCPNEDLPALIKGLPQISTRVGRAGLWRNRKKDGTVIDVEITSDLISFAGKQAKLVLANDVTERRRAEEALRKSEERFQWVTRATNDAIWDWDLLTNRLWWNERFKTMFGYNADEVEERIDWWRSRIHPEDRERIVASVQAAIDRGEQAWSGEYRFRRGDGSYASLLDRGYIVRNGRGQPVRMIGAMMDMTERKRDEAALAAEKERLLVTLRSIGDGVITTDVQERIRLMNKVAETLTGWTQKEAVGRPLQEIFHIKDEKSGRKLENPAAKALRTGAAVGLSENTVLIDRDGAERVIADSSAPIRDRTGQTIGVVLVFRDMTQKKRMEEDLLRTSKMEAVGLLAGGIAHDFNNILTAILGNLSLVKMSVDPINPLYKRLEDAEAASLRARDLAQQLLTFAKGGAPIKKTTSIKGLLRESIRFALRGSNVGVEFSIPDDLWPVEIDPGQISQVLHNMVINAQQAMPRGGVIRVKAENHTLDETDKRIPLVPGRYVRISIEDTGIGIPKEYLTKIFDPYFTTKQKGSGLGLSTSYSIIKKHGGYITVDSELEKGSVFSICLPASSRDLEPEGRSEAPLPGRGKILIMDDEQAVREVAGEILRLLGYEIDDAEDGAEAIRRYRNALASGAPFDLVIMDLTVPGKMGGQEAIERLREIDPGVKAIVSSGYSNDPIMSEYSKYGFKGVIAKPYELEQLSKTVHDVINGAQE